VKTNRNTQAGHCAQQAASTKVMIFSKSSKDKSLRVTIKWLQSKHTTEVAMCFQRRLKIKDEKHKTSNNNKANYNT
jgi:hypothetical protein